MPLAPRAIALLEGQLEKSDTGEGLVFPSRSATPISDMTMTKFLRDQKVTSDTPGRIATAHGFRSSFRDWASENGFPRDVAERALAHTVKNATEAAYHRTDLLDQRRNDDRVGELLSQSLGRGSADGECVCQVFRAASSEILANAQGLWNCDLPVSWLVI